MPTTVNRNILTNFNQPGRFESKVYTSPLEEFTPDISVIYESRLLRAEPKRRFKSIQRQLRPRKKDTQSLSPEQLTRAQEKIIEEKFNSLIGKFKFSEISEVRVYLSRNAFLFEILTESLEQIYQYFGEETRVKLNVFKENTYESGKLFVEIYSNLEPETAINNLNEFDKNWWFRTSAKSHKYLEFSLEFE